MQKLTVTILFFCFLLSFSLPVFPESGMINDKLPEPFLIVPQPREVELLQGDGMEYGRLGNLVLTGDFKRPVMGCILSRLTESIEQDEGTLILKLGDNESVPRSSEGYLLTISNGDAVIISRGEAGLFYGCQTLEQLLEDARDSHAPIPACKITDYPALSYRAVHIDVKHHLDHMNYYYESIDKLARYKINAIIFEFEDKLRYRRQPLVGAPQSISIDEMAALTMYARERHIEISPLVQGLGHATFILKHQHYAHLRELPGNRWAFCPMDDGTYEVLFDLYSDAIEATPGSKYLHVGGDEIGNIGLCPRCKPTADKEGLLYLNLYWLKKVCEFAGENGRIPIFWDDMPLKEAGVYPSTYRSDISFEQASADWEKGGPVLEKVISEFPKNCIYMRWNYSMARQPGNIMALDWYRSHRLAVMIATAAQTGATLIPFDSIEGMESNGINAIRSFIQLAAEKEIDGMLCTAWDDKSPHMETYWRGLISSAEYSWSPSNRTLAEYDIAYLQREYGISMRDYPSFYAGLREAAVFWEKAFNREGSRTDMNNALFNLPGLAHWMPPKDESEPLKTDFTDLLIELPDLTDPGSWSNKYEKRLNEAELIVENYLHTSGTIKLLKNQSKRNRYHWDIISAINDFQITAPRLLLALFKCDTDDSEKFENGIKEVNNALAEFNKAWRNLLTVYAETRFISYPENYIPDRYFHFASQREDLTWMIQVEELFHEMIQQWMEKENLKETNIEFYSR